MLSFQFKALGTAWSISVDQADFASPSPQKIQELWDKVIAETAEFEAHFSRFKGESESRQFLSAVAGTFPISAELTKLLVAADTLRALTKGSYDPAVGGLMEATGYSPEYTLQPDEDKLSSWHVPHWSVQAEDQTVTIDGPVLFDFGGMGKGYWIDQLSELLTRHQAPHHLVEGGGDMMATTKADGTGWNVAIEYPGKTDLALGTYELKHQGLAASDVFRRRWGKWHHFVDLKLKQPTQHILGCVAVSGSAWKADQITSLLALTDPAQFSDTVPKIGGEYVALLSNETAIRSQNWQGILF